jgi:Cupin superfamily protein
VEKAPSTLAELVAPLSEASFMTLLRERKLTLLRGAGADRYSSLLNWKSLLQMIERGQHPSSLAEFNLVKDSQLAPPDRWLKRNPSGDGNVVDLPRFLAFMAHGFSLSVTRIDAHAPHLKALCRSIRSTLREQIKMGVIVTTGKGGAFTLHYDPEDLIILQVEGRKRWKIFGPPVVNPFVGMAPAAAPPEDTLIFDEILEAGDFLFLPAGNWHRCENESSRSLHLGIFFQPPNGLDVIKALTSQLLSDDQLRAPLTRLDGPTDLSAVEADIKSRAMERISKLDLREFFSRFESGV